MAHYAFLDDNNIVIEIIPGRNEDEVIDGISDWESYYGAIRNRVCKRTSYNTHGGINTLGGTAFRKNYGLIGYAYDYQLDAFIPPKPFNSWILNEETCLWEAPVTMPVEEGKIFIWDEETVSWQEIAVS